MSNDDENTSKFGFNQGSLHRNLQEDRCQPEHPGLYLGKGLWEHLHEGEMDTGLHPCDQDCPRAFRRQFQR